MGITSGLQNDLHKSPIPPSDYFLFQPPALNVFPSVEQQIQRYKKVERHRSYIHRYGLWMMEMEWKIKAQEKLNFSPDVNCLYIGFSYRLTEMSLTSINDGTFHRPFPHAANSTELPTQTTTTTTVRRMSTRLRDIHRE